MKISLIWAQDKNKGIGKKGKLPWYISEDLKNFKKLTLNSTIIMGRKTWESLPIKPLPNRVNIVLSRNKIEGINSFSSIESCINFLKLNCTENIFIIGGRSLYKEFYSKSDVLHITIINKIVKDIDTFYPFSMEQIEEEFNKIKEYSLSKEAIYSYWERRT